MAKGMEFQGILAKGGRRRQWHIQRKKAYQISFIKL